MAAGLSDRTARVAVLMVLLAGHFAGGSAAAQQAPRTPLFRDCPQCPEMLRIPAGSFTMGSPAYEEGRFDAEGPEHPVSVPAFALGRYHVTRGQFATFAAETGHSWRGGCWGLDYAEDKWKLQAPLDWKNPGFQQAEHHPVVCVSWEDAQAYVGWLTKKTGKRYRLPSEAEWEYAARAGTTTARWWGNGQSQACAHANVADTGSYKPAVDRLLKAANSGKEVNAASIHSCDDRYVYTSPVGSFAANAFGLFDMIGNAWQWTQDCSNESYAGGPSNGQAWEAGECGRRVARGGSWNNYPRVARSALRDWIDVGGRYDNLGFRVARTY